MSRVAFALPIGVFGLTFSATGLAMRTMEFLEKYDLGALTYIRMYPVECGEKKWVEATVLDPEALPHRVRVGSYVGRNFGMVTSITDERIELMEVHRNIAGEWVERRAVMPRVAHYGPKTRYLDEEDHALDMLEAMDDSGRLMKKRLIECRKLYGEDAKRLACFDEAVGTLF